MILQIVLVAAVLRASVAWPITPVDEYSRTDTQNLHLECGEVAEFREATFTNLNFTFNDFNENGNIEAGCTVKIRIAVEDLSTFKYGIQVNGMIDVNDDSNGNDCSSSYLTVADEDDLEDELGSIERYCNKESITFKTTEDILVIEFVVGENGASGTGFQLTIAPHYLCGGQVEVEKAITSPDYPESYPRDINCVWRVQAPEGHHIILKCRDFNVKPKKGNKCLDYLLLLGNGVMKQFCGDELNNKEVKFESNVLIMDFRTNQSKNGYIGFRCKPKFVQSTKDLLLAKFFK